MPKEHRKERSRCMVMLGGSDDSGGRDEQHSMGLVSLLTIAINSTLRLILNAGHRLGSGGDAVADRSKRRELGSTCAGIVLVRVGRMRRGLGLTRWLRCCRRRPLLWLGRCGRRLAAVRGCLSTVGLQLPAEHINLSHVGVAARLESFDVLLLSAMLVDGCMNLLALVTIKFRPARSLTFGQDFPLGSLGTPLLWHLVSQSIK